MEKIKHNYGGGVKTVKQIFGISGEHRKQKDEENYFGINKSIYQNLETTKRPLL